MKKIGTVTFISTVLALTATTTIFTITGCTLIFGSLLYPKSIGLYLGLPYYTYTVLWSRPEFHKGARWMAFARHFPLFVLLRRYLQMTIDTPLPTELVQADDAVDAQLLIAMFPHGTASDYRVALDGMINDVLPHTGPKLRTLVASVLFRLPIVREFCLFTGCVDARRSVAEGLLDNGHSLLVLPGGEAEQLQTEYGHDKVFLKKRLGFIKLAMRKNVPVVPSYVFGVSDYYYTSNALLGLRWWLMKKVAVCIPLAAGVLGHPLCPRPVPTTVVLGKPLLFAMKEQGNPTASEVQAGHAEFIKALVALFDQHKERLGYGDRELEVV